MYAIDEILEEQGVSRGNMETALELVRLVQDDTGLCCEELGQFT